MQVPVNSMMTYILKNTTGHFENTHIFQRKKLQLFEARNIINSSELENQHFYMCGLQAS